MKTIDISCTVTKWEQSNTNFSGRIQDGDKPKFGLHQHHPLHKSVMQVINNIYVTNIETDFILDIDITTTIQFDIEGIKPTADELYSAFIEVKKKEYDVIMEELVKRSTLLVRSKDIRPLDDLRPKLQGLINTTYKEN